MILYVDADSFPAPAREVLYRAAERRRLKVCFVSAKPFKIPKSTFLRFIVVEPGPDAADRMIESLAIQSDMVLTRDIPFAAALVERDITVLNDRGQIFNRDNIQARLRERDTMAELRGMGLAEMGIRSYGKKELKDFADCLDRELTRRNPSKGTTS